MSVELETCRTLARPTPSRILLIVLDGLGGLPHPELENRTELDCASLPHLNALTRRASTGLSHPIAPGVTPGSAPAHLALFGYDPLRHAVGRGVLSALGVDFELVDGDVAARISFCSLGHDGTVTDRRAGGLPTEVCARLASRLAAIHIPGIDIFVRPEMGHRAALVLRGPGLDGRVTDSDPGQERMAPLSVRPLVPEAMRTAEIVNTLLEQAEHTLRNEDPANMILLRGFAQHEEFPSLSQLWRLTPAAVAAYPMFRGVSRLVGMKVLQTGSGLEEQVATLETHWSEHDFFFVHVRKPDAAAREGNPGKKIAALEAFDAILPRLLALGPEVVSVVGSHSTPSIAGHQTWHPVPLLLWSRSCRPDGIAEFNERALRAGSLWPMRHVELMPLLMAHAGKLAQYGA
ncbi:MAG: 2,3-bisphosphoglycerate-independent phosphoglycerate mutase [Candidatus Eisenbacteria bacterium]|nr:2,3-bisphosphoglycerate-independent phosphoglycerate mutase [Candidatus Eisenbacteria bacterium]MCC7143598.1 2,3-bisphosphoglycerate-independent phosphoglycerate mutase [Candidatus Eisenbacteria bacterium]